MRLLLDLGNTRLKWALQAQDGALWHRHGAVGWDEDVKHVINHAWLGLGLPAPREVIGASVVDGAREAQVAAVAKALWSLDIHWLCPQVEACGVRSAYVEPQRLGVDRFLAMVAAHAAGYSPCVLVGVGTALTLDALAVNGRHLGGLLAPGPQLMQRSLISATARVRPERPGQVLEIADNTADAVASGCWHAAAALIERFAARMAPVLGGSASLCLGGGDAIALLPLLEQPAQLMHDGVLHGLAIWANAHAANRP